MKTKLIGSVLCFMSSFSVFGSGIPVVDGAGLAQRQAEFVEQASRWVEQIKQYEKDYKMFENQYKKAQEQYNAISGVRDLRGALKYLGAQNWSADDLTKWLSDPNKILTSGFDSLSPELRSKANELGFNEMCNYQNSERTDYYKHKLRKNCEGQVVLNLLQSAKYEKAVNARKQEDEDLQEQISELTNTKDTKESADNTNALIGVLIQENRNLKRNLEDQANQNNAKESLAIQQDATFKIEQQKYIKREMKW